LIVNWHIWKFLRCLFYRYLNILIRTLFFRNIAVYAVINRERPRISKEQLFIEAMRENSLYLLGLRLLNASMVSKEEIPSFMLD
jgi:hypothetical protein